MKTKEQITKRIEFLEKDYEIAYNLQNTLDMYDEKEAADFDELSEQLKVTKTKITVLEWILES